LQIFIVAIADSGVFGDGFQMQMSPADRGKHRIPRPHRDREVERADDADQAERLVLVVHAMARALRMHGGAVHHAALADREIGDVDHLLHFAIALGLDLAHLQRDQRTQRILVLAQGFAAQAHRFATQAAPASCARP
jgi:hypothetical protein